MHNTVNNITIVGGGTSGWLTAAYLLKNTVCNITVVDKEVGTPVGVGEGTLLGFKHFLTECGFKQEEWFDAIDATYKAGILFPQFNGDKNLVWHPFILNMDYSKYDANVYEALTYIEQEKINELMMFFNISLENKIDLNNLNSAYAMHIDCSKLVIWLQEKILSRITLIKSEVVAINRTDNIINHLTLKNGDTINSDLFVDCTGFNQVLQHSPQRTDLTNRLFCDTAVAGHVPYIDAEVECMPYVECPAVDHGWIWKIPVRSRTGTGLVFNRSITSIDEAKQYLCKHWNDRITPDDLKVIDWTPYYNKNMWDGNVVAIGLSGGFIEPLESTGIGSITNAIIYLTHSINTGYYNECDIEIFNSTMSALYEDAIDFVNMHYIYTDKNTPFWNHVKENIIPSETYLYYKNIIEAGTSINYNGKGYLFGGANWICWLLQFEKNIRKNKNIDDDIANEILSNWSKTISDVDNSQYIISHLQAIK
jgi:flavin-dependent dehydrogenase